MPMSYAVNPERESKTDGFCESFSINCNAPQQIQQVHSDADSESAHLSRFEKHLPGPWE